MVWFYDFPAGHWIHLRTTNPIAFTLATVRLRTNVTRRAGSGTAALAMVFKLIESAQQRWRAVNASHLVALVRAGERGQSSSDRSSAPPEPPGLSGWFRDAERGTESRGGK